jgi:hypothetical protein
MASGTEELTTASRICPVAASRICPVTASAIT